MKTFFKEFKEDEILNSKICKFLKVPYLKVWREAVYGPGMGRVVDWFYCGKDYCNDLNLIHVLEKEYICSNKALCDGTYFKFEEHLNKLIDPFNGGAVNTHASAYNRVLAFLLTFDIDVTYDKIS